MDMEVNERKRDRRLRRRLLRMLFGARGSALGGLKARAIADVAESPTDDGDRIEDDEHLLTLLRDLEAGGYVTLADTRTEPKYQRFGVGHLFARVTTKGSALVNKSIPRDPDVDDDRDPEEPA